MFCKECGKEIKKNTKFCSKCGKEVGSSSVKQEVSISKKDNDVVEGEIITDYPKQTFIRSFLEKLGGLAAGLLGFVIFVGLMVGAYIILSGTASLAIDNISLIFTVNNIALAICVFVFIPLAIFDKTRIISCYGLLFGSYALGLTVWLYGLAVTYSLWGLFWVIVGLFIAGVGVVPIGLLAAVLGGYWSVAGILIYGCVITYGFRWYAVYLGEKIDEANMEVV